MTSYGTVTIFGNDDAPLVKVATFTATPATVIYYGAVKILSNDDKPLLKVANYVIAGAISAAVATKPQWGQLWPRGDYTGT